MKLRNKSDYREFLSKITWRFCGIMMLSFFVVMGIYLFIWQQRVGDWVLRFLVYFMGMEHEEAFYIYHQYFREYREVYFVVAIIFMFIFLLLYLFSWMTRYFKEINQGISSLLSDNKEEIHLSPEMNILEQKLNTVKKTLEKRKVEMELAERRKNDLVMYLAHDIRTPLTSVIGYLNLLKEETDMSIVQRAKYLHIALDKAYRLEKMIDEFFEITQYNSHQIELSKVHINLYYMLVQLTDELSPLLSMNRNSIVLKVDENLNVYADADKLARVFSNILKNAGAYSFPNTEIIISAYRKEKEIIVCFQNKGKTIPSEKLVTLFDKFYRLDESRVSNTGGTGLGLAIAREIMELHGGNISAASTNEIITFTVKIPVKN